MGKWSSVWEAVDLVFFRRVTIWIYNLTTVASSDVSETKLIRWIAEKNNELQETSAKAPCGACFSCSQFYNTEKANCLHRLERERPLSENKRGYRKNHHNRKGPLVAQHIGSCHERVKVGDFTLYPTQYTRASGYKKTAAPFNEGSIDSYISLKKGVVHSASADRSPVVRSVDEPSKQSSDKSSSGSSDEDESIERPVCMTDFGSLENRYELLIKAIDASTPQVTSKTLVCYYNPIAPSEAKAS